LWSVNPANWRKARWTVKASDWECRLVTVRSEVPVLLDRGRHRIQRLQSLSEIGRMANMVSMALLAGLRRPEPIDHPRWPDLLELMSEIWLCFVKTPLRRPVVEEINDTPQVLKALAPPYALLIAHRWQHYGVDHPRRRACLSVRPRIRACHGQQPFCVNTRELRGWHLRWEEDRRIRCRTGIASLQVDSIRSNHCFGS